MFLQVVGRPDLSFAVNVVSRYLENPIEDHWTLIKRIFRYLKGTIDKGLLYGPSDQFSNFSDADYTSNKETRRSVSGVLCMHAGAAISWQCKRQQCISLLRQ